MKSEAVSTPAELDALYGRLANRWALRNEEMEYFRQLRFMEIEPRVPIAYEAHTVRMSDAHQIIGQMTGTLTTDPLTIKVPPASQTIKAQEASSKMERWTLLALEKLQKQAGVDNVERLVEHLLSDAHACMRVLYARDPYWKGYPARKKDGEKGEDYTKRTEDWKKGQPIPISWTVLDPLNVYPMFTELGLQCIVERDRRDIATLKPKSWKLKKNAPELYELIVGEAEAQGDVEFTQVWYPNSLVYAVNGKIVHTQRHRYGKCPYVYAFGIGSTSRRADRIALSVLFPLRHILPYQDELLSQKASAIAMYGWPTPVWERAPNPPVLGEDGNPIEAQMEVVMGETVTLDPGDKLGFLQWQGSVPDLDEMIGLVRMHINRAGLSDVLYGIDQPGQSGYRLNQLISAAKTKFKPIVSHAERALEQVICLIWDIVEYQVKEPVYLYSDEEGKAGWIGLGPDDLQGYREVQVTLNPIMPTDSYARSSMAINEVGARIQSRRGAMEATGKEQPEETENQILVETWKDSPEAMKFLIQHAIERAGIQLQKSKEATIEELIKLLPSLPPALQQAIVMVMQGGPQGAGGAGPQGAGGMGRPGMRPPPVGVTAAPGVAAVPQAPGARRVMPSGMATGRAPGVRRRGIEG